MYYLNFKKILEMIKNQSYLDDISNNEEKLEAYQLKNIEQIIFYKQKLKRKNINITELRKKLNIKQEEINSLKEEIKKLKDKA